MGKRKITIKFDLEKISLKALFIVEEVLAEYGIEFDTGYDVCNDMREWYVPSKWSVLDYSNSLVPIF